MGPWLCSVSLVDDSDQQLYKVQVVGPIFALWKPIAFSYKADFIYHNEKVDELFLFVVLIFWRVWPESFQEELQASKYWLDNFMGIFVLT